MFQRTSFRHAPALLIAFASTLAVIAHAATPGVAVQAQNLPAVAPVIDCAKMAATDLTKAIGAEAKIQSAEVVNDGKSSPYCKVQIQIENFIDFEVHLPLANWTQRLLFSGNNYQPAKGVGEFVITKWQDLGHRSHEDLFATDYEHRIDYGYRSMHLIVVSTKEMIKQFYSKGPKFTYYAACSEPAREGMVDLQRYPDDYDGVVAGCAPTPMTVNNGIYNPWNMLVNSRADGSSILLDEKTPLIYKTSVEQCDAKDGLKDGLISDPYNCHPDFSALLCKQGADDDSCLTAEQMGVLKEIYRSAHDENGLQLVPQGPLPGSEKVWKGLISGSKQMAANYEEVRVGNTLAIKYLFTDPPKPEAWKLSDLKFNLADFNDITKLRFLYDGTNPDLSAYAAKGHKLLFWHGLADVMVPSSYNINYYNAVVKTMGQPNVDKFMRFFLFPGVYHCGGGVGPSTHDFMTPLMAWVEKGIAPNVLMAEQYEKDRGAFGGVPEGQKPLRTRPVYPYPYMAKYTGKGSIDDAKNFVKGPKMTIPTSLGHWAGEGFYTSDYQKVCTGKEMKFDCKPAR